VYQTVYVKTNERNSLPYRHRSLMMAAYFNAVLNIRITKLYALSYFTVYLVLI